MLFDICHMQGKSMNHIYSLSGKVSMVTVIHFLSVKAGFHYTSERIRAYKSLAVMGCLG